MEISALRRCAEVPGKSTGDMASSMAEKENISMGTEARASGDSVGDHPKDKGKKHPVVIADLMKVPSSWNALPEFP